MEENRKKNLTITIIGIITLIVATIGATFAYFSSVSNTTAQSVKTGELKLNATSSKLNATNIKPTTWNSVIANNVANENIAQVMLSVNTYGTTVENAKYDIYLSTSGINLNTTDGLQGGSLADIKWKLVDASNTIIGSGDFSNGNYSDPTKITDNPIVIDNINSTEEESTKTYILFIYIEDNGQQDQLQGLNITATMSAKALQ